jgi:deoxycytidine triphosphate deaminase
VTIYAGEPICQILFTKMDQISDRPYRGNEKHPPGKYMHQTGTQPAILETINGA